MLKRFTTDPINVSKTMFTALDLVSIQTQTRVKGNKVRRNKSLTEINHYDAENDEINVQDVYQWQAETDEFLMMGDSNTLDEIQFDRGWSRDRLEEELFERRVILAYLIKNGLNEYTKVAATVQAYINDPETILTLIANEQLEESLEDLREMESVLIDVDPEKEALVPRPDAGEEIYNEATDILERAEERVFEEYRGQVPDGLGSALGGISGEEEQTITPDAADADDFDFGGGLAEDDVEEGDFDLGDDTEDFTFGSTAEGDEGVSDEGPGWLSDDGFDGGEDGDESDDAAAEEPPTATAEGTPELEGDRDDQTGDSDDEDETPALAAAGENAAEAGAEAAAPAESESPGPLPDADPADDGSGDTDEPVFSNPTDGEETTQAAPSGDADDAAGQADDVEDPGDDPVFSSSPDSDTGDEGTTDGPPAGDDDQTGGDAADGDAVSEEPSSRKSAADSADAESSPADAETSPAEAASDSAERDAAADPTTDDGETTSDEPGEQDQSSGDVFSDDETDAGESPFGNDADGDSPFGDDAADDDAGGDDALFDDGGSFFDGDDGDDDDGSGDDGGSIFGGGEESGGSDDGSVFGDAGDEDDEEIFGDDDESIFGETEGESIFSADDSDDSDGGSVFDGDEESDDDGSIFGDDEENDDGSVFGDGGSDDEDQR